MADGVPAVRLEDVPYIDNPELRVDEHESTEMPFRYVRGEDGGPVMPEVCTEICITNVAMFRVTLNLTEH